MLSRCSIIHQSQKKRGCKDNLIFAICGMLNFSIDLDPIKLTLMHGTGHEFFMKLSSFRRFWSKFSGFSIHEIPITCCLQPNGQKNIFENSLSKTNFLWMHYNTYIYNPLDFIELSKFSLSNCRRFDCMMIPMMKIDSELNWKDPRSLQEQGFTLIFMHQFASIKVEPRGIEVVSTSEDM